MTIMWKWGVSLVLTALLPCMTGCRTPRGGAHLPEEEPVEVAFMLGRITRVHAVHGYAVIQCASLPLVGEEATVHRDGQVIGRLRLAGPVRMPFVVADILDGVPAVGDQVWVVRSRPAETMDGGVW